MKQTIHIEDIITGVRERLSEDGPGYDFQGCATARDRMGPYFKEDVVAAIIVAKGNFGAMAILLNRRRQRVYDYVHGNRDVLEFWNDERGTSVDVVEQNQMERAMGGKDPAAERFILTTLGKERGYTTRVDNVSSDGSMTPPTTIDPSKMTKEGKKELLAAIKDGQVEET